MACLALVGTVSAAPAPACQKPSGGGFKLKTFGGPCPVGPEEGDYRESASHHAGGQPAVGVPDEQAFPKSPTPEPKGDPATTPPPLPEGKPMTLPEQDPPRAEAAAAVARAEADETVYERVQHWVWPGPESPARRARRQRAEADAAEADEGLKDAPAAVSPERYSLWSGLSRPLLLPSQDVRAASPSTARELGERDYASHILSQDAGVRMPAATDGLPARATFPKPLPVRQAVEVEVDIKETPGEWRASAAELGRRVGFEVDAAVEPRFIGKLRAKAVLSGTVHPGQLTALSMAPGVRRVEYGPGVSAPVAQGETSLLVGLRIPPGVAPMEALKEAAARLAQNASFQLERPLAYQKVPGTDQTVIVVLGRIPVRAMGTLLSDPSVAKVAPYAGDGPVRPAPEPVPAWRQALRQAVNEHPAYFLAFVLFLIASSGPFFNRRSRSK
ncbi:MAG: hypothetical protein HYZ75_11445 [Elusimicrobia bacterium]|nr:hypothetical protein [Elusimicrobiota bacterium]